MSNKYSRLKPKIKPLPFIILGAVLVVVAVLAIVLQPNKKNLFYENYKYSDIPKDHIFKEITFKQLKSKQAKNEKMLVYFGYPQCTNCIEEVKYYNIEFFNENMDEYFDSIYYVDLTKLKSKDFQKLAEDYGISGNPETGQFNAFLIYFEEGEIKVNRNSFTGGKIASNIKNFYIKVKESFK